jgi:7,8-dihydropterin-6-yl-methyl-4-(beta-D-ribofuranosyl)aminobenzene 5'-phosphate synthase
MAEHGWAVHLETEQGAFLLDTGQGLTLLSNATFFGVHLERLNGVFLSHHHLDHTGGLMALLRLRQPAPTDIHAHPELFKDSYRVEGGEVTHIGVPFSRAALEGQGARFHLGRAFRQVAPGLYLTGEVPRWTDFETGDPYLMIAADGGYRRDALRDDQALVVEGERGLSVVLGCSHAGLINTLRYVSEQTGQSRFHTVMGGTHLGLCDAAQLKATVTALQAFDIERLGVSHCTGQAGAMAIAHAFGERFFHCSVGTQVEL